MGKTPKTNKEWWIDDVGEKVCGPWAEISKIEWPAYDYVYHAIDYSEFERVEAENAKLRHVTGCAKQVIDHWHEFGPEHGLDEYMHHLELAVRKSEEKEND